MVSEKKTREAHICVTSRSAGDDEQALGVGEDLAAGGEDRDPLTDQRSDLLVAAVEG